MMTSVVTMGHSCQRLVCHYSTWFAGLKWQIGQDCETSFLEIAAKGFIDGIHFMPKKEEIEPLKTGVAAIRAVVAAAGKRNHQLCSGSTSYPASKCNGHRHPNGVIKGAKLFLGNKTLHLLANGFQRGCTAKLGTWSMLVTSLL